MPVHQCTASQVSSCIKVISFRLDTGPASFPPMDYRLSIVCSKSLISARTSSSRCFEAEPSHILASCTRAPARSSKSCRLFDGVKVPTVIVGRHNSGEIKVSVSWCKNSTVTVERACSANAPSCNGAVSMETVQMILDP